MFSFRKKTPKVIFQNSIPCVSQTMPIVPSASIKHEWAEKAIEEYRAIKNNPESKFQRTVHVARCPGISHIMRHGWVMKTYQDFWIETTGDHETFNWGTAINQKEMSPGDGDYIAFHHSQQLFKHMNDWPSNSIKTLIKIQSGWTVQIPKDYYLLEMPVAHNDDSRFTTLTGFVPGDQGPVQLNPSLRWNVISGKTLIQAGTPIAQYFLVKREHIDMEVKGVERDESIIRKFLTRCRFNTDYNVIRNYFSK